MKQFLDYCLLADHIWSKGVLYSNAFHLFDYSFISLFNKCLLCAYCVLGTFLDSVDIAENKTKTLYNLMKLTF